MGIRIHQAMGYGMPVGQLKDLCLLPEHDDGVVEAISECLSAVTELLIPEDDELWQSARAIWPDLLSLDYEWGGRRATNADCLVNGVYQFNDGNGNEGTSHLIFYPDACAAQQWFRFNDDLDYAIATRANPDDPCQDQVDYVKYGFYPYTNYVRDAQGNYAKWDGPAMLDRQPTFAAAPPPALVWWTTKLGIFSTEGAMKLRPIIARWWS